MGSWPRSVGSPTYALQNRRVWFHSFTTRYARSAQSGGTVACGRTRITRISSVGPSSVNSTACRSHRASRLPDTSVRYRISTASRACDRRSNVIGQTVASVSVESASDVAVATADDDSLSDDVSAWPARQDHHGIARAPCFGTFPADPYIGEYSYV